MTVSLRLILAASVAIASPFVASTGCGGSSPAPATPSAASTGAVAETPTTPPTASPSSEPASSAAAKAPAAEPTTIVANLASPTHLAIDAGNVYIVDKKKGWIAKAPITGGDAAPLAADQKGVGDLAVDATSVYWTTSDGKGGGAIHKVAVDGKGKPSVLATVPGSDYGGPIGIEVDDKFVYWLVSTEQGSVQRTSKAGGMVTTLATGQRTPYGLALTPDAMVWTDYGSAILSGAVMMLPKSSTKATEPTKLADKQKSPWCIVVDATDAYWATTGDPAKGVAGAINKAPLAGGATTVLATDAKSPTCLAIDATSVYWTTSDEGTVSRVAKTGGAATVIAKAQPGPASIAADAGAIYFTTLGDGAVRKLATK
jgi:sugar lactone lactonase YvrE